MNEHIPKEENLQLMEKIEINSDTTQRTLSSKLSIFLGKTNRVLNALIER